MSQNDPAKVPATWTPEMLREFHKFINSVLPVSFTILEKQKLTKFYGKQISSSFWSRQTSQISYRGVIAVPELENTAVILNAVKSLDEDTKNYIGYMEVVNSFKEGAIPVPEIRGVILEDSGICEIFDEMMNESKIFNVKMSPDYIYLEHSSCLKDRPPEELLKKKLPIREISTFQKISCTGPS